MKAFTLSISLSLFLSFSFYLFLTNCFSLLLSFTLSHFLYLVNYTFSLSLTHTHTCFYFSLALSLPLSFRTDCYTLVANLNGPCFASSYTAENQLSFNATKDPLKDASRRGKKCKATSRFWIQHLSFTRHVFYRSSTTVAFSFAVTRVKYSCKPSLSLIYLYF